MEKFTLDDFALPCHWHPDITCKKGMHCDGCEYQPLNDEKPNGKRRPTKLRWEEQYGMIVPICPSCGETPYKVDCCIFCGQKFIQDARTREFAEPPEETRIDCPYCHGINTMVGYLSKLNGHFHGKCKECGSTMIQ